MNVTSAYLSLALLMTHKRRLCKDSGMSYWRRLSCWPQQSAKTWKTSYLMYLGSKKAPRSTLISTWKEIDTLLASTILLIKYLKTKTNTGLQYKRRSNKDGEINQSSSSSSRSIRSKSWKSFVTHTVQRSHSTLLKTMLRLAGWWVRSDPKIEE